MLNAMITDLDASALKRKIKKSKTIEKEFSINKIIESAKSM